MTTTGTWIRTTEGRYVFDQGDGWYFDHLDQAWFQGDPPPSVPTGAPAAARARRFGRDLTEKPSGVFMAAATAYRDGFCGFLAFLIGWASRGFIVYALGWTVLHLGPVWRGLVEFFTVPGMDKGEQMRVLDAPGSQEAADLMVKAVVLLAFALLAFLFLVILSLNPQQSAALTTAFVAHRMYRHYVQDMGGTTANLTPQQRGP